MFAATTTTKSIAIKPTIMVLSSLAQTTSSGSTTGVSSSSAECSLVGRRLASLVVSLLNSEQQQRILLDETGRERRVALTDVLTPTEICEVFFSGGTFGVRVDRKVEKGGFEPGISIKEFEFGKVSERSERALRKTSILAMNPAKCLKTSTSTTKLTHSNSFGSLGSLVLH